jgi:hypothetical protein
MTSKTTNKFSPEVRARAVRLVLDHEREYTSRWAAVTSIAAKIGCTGMTRPCRSWPKAKPSRGASGPMCAMIGRSRDVRRRLLFFMLRATADMSIRRSTFTASPASCRPMRIAATTAYSGYNELYDPARPQEPITAALCWAHARRQFFELADIATNARRGKNASAISPIALEALKRINALFDIERGINGQSAEERLRVRREQSAPLLAELEAWLRQQRSRLSSSASVAEPIDYMLRRWERFARFVNDGRICLTNNAAERCPARICTGAEVVALCRLRTRRPARRLHGDASHDCEAQQCRSSSLAGRLARADRRAFHPQSRRTLAVELGHRDGAS